MKNLKVGDKVRCKAYCIINGGDFTQQFNVGVEYTIKDNDLLLYCSQGFFDKHFELVTTPKPTSVLVTTKREFDLLMGDFSKKGYVVERCEYNLDFPIITIEECPDMYSMDNKDGVILLPFSEYAKIAGIEVKAEVEMELENGKAQFCDSHLSFEDNFGRRFHIYYTDLDKLYETYKLRKG